RHRYRFTLLVRIQVEAGLGDRAGAVRAAQTLRDLGWAPPVEGYEGGRHLAICIQIGQMNEKATTAELATESAFYGYEAMKLLRDAVAGGFADATRMGQDVALAPLRQRDDFKELLAGLKAKKP